MRKRFFSLFLTLTMVLTLVSGMSFKASAEMPSEVINFNNKQEVTSSNFTLNAPYVFQDVGWLVGYDSGYGKHFSITIAAKDSSFKITGIDAVVSRNGLAYDRVNYSSGDKLETGSVSDGTTVHVRNINSNKLVITGTESSHFSCQLKDFTIYYMYPHNHDFTSKIYKDNGNGTHSEKCVICDEYGGTEPHIFVGGKCICSISDLFSEFFAYDFNTEAESTHFKLQATEARDKDGWNLSYRDSITITTKDDSYIITGIDAIAGWYGSNYPNVVYSSGEKVETGGVANRSAIRVRNIDSNRLEITCPSGYFMMKDITVYGTHKHDFSGEAKDNGNGTHSQKCKMCSVYGEPEKHSYLSGSCICGNSLPYEKFVFRNIADIDNTHFSLHATYPDNYGWNLGFGNTITISPKDSSYQIVCVDALVDVYASNYQHVVFSSGEKVEKGSVDSYSTVHIININSDRLDISCKNTWGALKDITVYYAKKHDFTGEYKDNGNGTHSRKCIDCDEYDDAVSHTFENCKCVCGATNHDFTGEYKDNGNGTHSRKCTKCNEYNEAESHTFENCKCVCGAINHDFTGEYKDIGNGTHSQKCRNCDEYNAAESHAFENCKCVCGATNHDFSGEVKDNGDGTHSMKCTKCDEYGDAVEHSFIPATCTEPKTCSVCHMTEGKALGHYYVATTMISEATCTQLALYIMECTRCDAKLDSQPVGKLKNHTWLDATCTEPKKCSVCGTKATLSYPLGHNYRPIKKVSDNPLTYTAKCTRCDELNENYQIPEESYDYTDTTTYQSVGTGETLKKGTKLQATSVLGDGELTVYIDGELVTVVPSGETWVVPKCLKCVDYKTDIIHVRLTMWFETACCLIFANCEEPETCVYCGNTEGNPLGHTWVEATCTAPRTCSECGLTDGASIGHTWRDATCTAPKTCLVCGETEGTTLEHNWISATCTAPKTCSVCRTTDGEPLSHTWQEATCTEPKKCSVCETEFTPYTKPLGHEYKPIKKVSDNPLTYTAKCMRCGDITDDYKIAEKEFDYTDTTTYREVEIGDILRGGTKLTATATAGKGELTVYIDDELVTVVPSGETWVVPECVKCLDYDTKIIPVRLTMWFETACNYTFANCEDSETCVYCGHTEGYPLGHSFENGVCAKCGEYEKDEITLDISGNNFIVTTKGYDAKTGVVIVGLYNNEELLEVKLFDISKNEKPQGSFEVNGKVRAFWWKDLETLIPMCECVEK